MATAAAAILAQTKLEIQHHFFAVDAVRAERAVAFKPSSAIQARQFEKMLERGIIKREGTDKYWIDAIAYDIDKQQQRRQIIVFLLVLVVVLAVALIGVVIGGGHTVTK